MEFDLILPLNRKQILLDWVNTIDEPRCLLVSSVDDLQDGNVFIEIVKSFLKSKFEYRHLLQEIKNLDRERFGLKRKFEIIFELLYEFVDENKIKKFVNTPFEKFINSEEALLDFTLLLKSIHSGEEEKVLDKEENYKHEKKSDKYMNLESLDENEYNYEVDSIQFSPVNNLAKKKKSNTAYNTNTTNKPTYSLKKNFESDIEYSDEQDGMKFIAERIQKMSTNNNEQKHKEVKFGITNVKFDIIPEDKDKKQIPKNNKITKEAITPIISTPPRKVNNNTRNFINFYRENSENLKNNQITSNTQRNNTNSNNNEKPTHSNDNSFTQSRLTISNNNYTRSVSPTHSNLTQNSFSPNPPNVDFNKVYSKREKAELTLLRGLPFPNQSNHKPNYIDLNNYKVNFLKFLRPTNPVLGVDFTNWVKYTPSSDYLKNSIENSKKINNKNNQGSRSPLRTNNNVSKLSNLNKQEEHQNTNNNNYDVSNNKSPTVENEDYFTNNTKDNIPLSLKNKIYFWLIDLNILRENSIGADDLPSICANGVLLADLVNRLEGRAEQIKGIVRKTTTKSHIQVNINKVLEHLRAIGKINSRHLWSNNNIAGGDTKTIWELLDDIWHFYSNKNGNIKNDVVKRKTKSTGNVKSNTSPLRSNTNASSNNINSYIPQPTKREDNYTTLTLNDNSIDMKFYPSGPSTRAYVDNLSKFEAYTDVANYNKIVKKREKSHNVKMNTNTNNNDKSLDSNGTGRNLNVIANCLGIDSTRAKKKVRKVESQTNINSNNNTDHYLSFNSNNNILGSSNILSTIESKRKSTNTNNNNNRNNYSHANTTRALSAIPNGKSNSKAKADSDKSCFIIFQKSNVKKLKKEIERYNSNVSAGGYNSENNNSIINFNEDSGGVYKENNSKNNGNLMMNIPHSILDSPEDYCNNNQLIRTKSENKSFSNLNQHLLSTDESSSNLKKRVNYIGNNNNSNTILTPVDKDERIIKEWLVNIGIKPAININFSQDDISEFKDGLLLSSIISILENRKIAGINPNPRSSSAGMKNISKCLEVLRNKKNMPYDFLWSDEEIHRGNGFIIRELLKQMKKVYAKESEYLHTQGQNFETFNN